MGLCFLKCKHLLSTFEMTFVSSGRHASWSTIRFPFTQLQVQQACFVLTWYLANLLCVVGPLKLDVPEASLNLYVNDLTKNIICRYAVHLYTCTCSHWHLQITSSKKKLLRISKQCSKTLIQVQGLSELRGLCSCTKCMPRMPPLRVKRAFNFFYSYVRNH